MITILTALAVLIFILAVIPFIGMLHTHCATATHTGGGTEEILNTANYGSYTVPQGSGQWLYALLAVVTTPVATSYVRVEADEWDGEDLYTIPKGPTLIDPSDFQFLDKPRFCPGGSVIRFYALHNGNEAVHCVALFRAEAPSLSIKDFRGESRIVCMTHVANTTANAWTTTGSYKFPAERGPFAIVGGIAIGATQITARLVVPQMPNSLKPILPPARAPAAGVEGPLMGKLLEPVIVPANETVTCEELNTGAVATVQYIEFVAAQARGGEVADKPNQPSVSSFQPKVEETSRTNAGVIGGMAALAALK